jgi:predicted membrane channel-forming protein YqfA (hemolysin III family)
MLTMIGFVEVLLEKSFIITPIYLVVTFAVLITNLLLRKSSRKIKITIFLIVISIGVIVPVHALLVTWVYTSFITTQALAIPLFIIETIVYLLFLVWYIFTKRLRSINSV